MDRGKRKIMCVRERDGVRGRGKENRQEKRRDEKKQRESREKARR